MPRMSLIVAVYNKPEILRLLLAACSRQTFKDFEIIIADDGSTKEISDVVNDWRKMFSLPIEHLWHPDAGWRKNVMLNNSIRASNSDYLVFIDGDCLPEKNFLLDHWNEKEIGRVLLGRRVEMSERWSKELTLEKIITGKFERVSFRELFDGIKGDALRLEDGIRLSASFLRKISIRGASRILGSNFSVHRSDLVAINGFDEAYDGPGHGEDSDIQYRLSLIGVKGKSLRNLAIQFHVYHPRTQTSDSTKKRFDEVLKNGEARCKDGLDKL